MRTFAWIMTGTDGNGQRWVTRGTVDTLPGEFMKIPEVAMAETFCQLTSGECCKNGPYRFLSMHIQDRDDLQAIVDKMG